MTVRSAIWDLLRALTGNNSDMSNEACITATYLLEQNRRVVAHLQSVGRDRSTVRHLSDDQDSIMRDIQSWYHELSEEGIFPAKFVGMILEEEEERAIVLALLALVQTGSMQGTGAASALTASGSLEAVSILADAICRFSPHRRDLGGQSVRSVAAILRSLNRGDALSDEQKGIVQAGVRALQFAMDHGLAGVLGPKEIAAQELPQVLSHVAEWL